MGKRAQILIYFVIIIITFFTYFNSLQNEFINYWDDNTYITGNDLIKTLNFSNLKLIFSSFFFTEYYPINLLSYAIDYHFWGLNPLGYHITNVFLHSLNAILIFKIITTMVNRFSVASIATIIFITLPVNVETVVWVSERKNMLSFLFFLVSFYLYIKYQKNENRYYYLGSIITYIFAILSKSSVVMFPFILFLYDFCFTKNRLQVKIINKIPFFIISIIASIIVILGSEGSPAFEAYQVNLYPRLLTTLRIFAAYVEKVFIPINLNNFYVNYVSSSILGLEIIISILVLSIITFCAYKCYKQEIVIFFCIMWFFINLIPVSNIIPIPHWIADRYLYFPSLAFSLLVATLFDKILKDATPSTISYKLKKITSPLLIIILIFYSSLTILRNSVWKDSVTLWENCVSKSPNSALAHTYLGGSYMKKGCKDKAVIEFKKALQLNPRRANALANLAYIDIDNGLLDEAFKKIRLALFYEEDNYEAHNALGVYYMSKAKYNRAIVEFQRALELRPESIIDFHLIYNNLGLAYQKEGQTQHAALAFSHASTFR
ncbi:MAG: hypothetical protein A3G70_03130 [Planctomycetes bacterium RIFCSPLOWO2_12_FULL_39_13]|nr:MAG: hypothetical protein A2Y09_11440 [Planctomycetes bacterium GWA2_39_15]OHB99829.1 MAG: hypothetical protein A3G70_03130 [Planctomycetes bacterium RIFCSPLOWO2_12_FULL_39_13]